MIRNTGPIGSGCVGGWCPVFSEARSRIGFVVQISSYFVCSD